MAEMDIYHALFWGCAVLVVVAELLILKATFAPPAEAAPTASPTDLPRSPRIVEIVWGVLPAFALGWMLWQAWRALA